jgi:hypothetical protein
MVGTMTEQTTNIAILLLLLSPPCCNFNPSALVAGVCPKVADNISAWTTERRISFCLLSFCFMLGKYLNINRIRGTNNWQRYSSTSFTSRGADWRRVVVVVVVVLMFFQRNAD